MTPAASTTTCGRFACSTRRRSGSCFESRIADWRRQLYSVVLPRHALAGLDITKVWSDRIDNPKTGVRIGSGPFLVESWERGKRLTLVRNSRYWGPHTAYLDRFVASFGAQDPLDPLAPLRRGRVRRHPDPRRQLRERGDCPRGTEASGVARRSRGRRPAMEHFAFRVGAGGHPALAAQARASGARVRHRPRGHRPRDPGGGTPIRASAAGQRGVPPDARPPTAPTGVATAMTSPAHSVCSRRRDADVAPTVSTRAPESASVCAS